MLTKTRKGKGNPSLLASKNQTYDGTQNFMFEKTSILYLSFQILSRVNLLHSKGSRFNLQGCIYEKKIELENIL